ncbi:MAG TPA: glycosyltransferase family 2 protein [Chthoniobacterales bacterium]|nr:glycosyltransferase family 2 protein [Chthoniobacterales bacterium]
MNQSPEISIIVPVYNEAASLPQLQAELLSVMRDYDHEIVFVDDGSSDDSAKQIQRSARIRLLQFVKNCGQSAAIYAGLAMARGRVLVLLDSDLQNDPNDIPRLLEEIEKGADLVCGYRAKRQDTWFKRFQSTIANQIRSRFTRDGVRDTGCTLKAMRRECREALIPFYGMHRFLPALIKGMGYKLVEIPVNHRPRRHGASKYTFGNRALRATIDMFGVRWLLSRQIKIRLKDSELEESRGEPGSP